MSQRKLQKGQKSENEDDGLEWLKPKILTKPDDQDDVPEADLEEDIPRILSTVNPNWLDIELQFNYGRREYINVKKPTFGKAYPLFIYQGTAIRKDSAEAKAQICAGFGMLSFDDSGPKRVKVKKRLADDEEEEEPEPAPPPVEEAQVEEEEKKDEEAPPEAGPEADAEPAQSEAPETAEGEQVEGEEKAEETEDTPMFEEVFDIKPRTMKLRNQFNFCDRATLTYNNPCRSVGTQSLPPALVTYGATAILSIIFEHYQEDYARKMRAIEDEKKKKRMRKATKKTGKSDQQIHDEKLSRRIREAWAILERLVNQNLYDHISQDYRYWDDPSDAFREGKGSLLPLWRFQYKPVQDHAVCDVQWNPQYKDLFAVAYGSLDFTDPQKTGCLCLYSIKNPAYPEYTVVTDSPVICLDVYKHTPYLICVGLFDGNVCVYNAQLTLETSYRYKSDPLEDKHNSIVWEIKWGEPLLDGELSFFSISGDGLVIMWALLADELQANIMMTLKSTAPPIPGPDGTLIKVNSCGSCICFHPTDKDIYIVGTEEGMIHTCSQLINTNYVRSVKGHNMPVYRIEFNYFNPSLYASCSADWRVKIWEDGNDEPLFTFDLGAPVGDVKWAPYSSTVFAACTTDGKVHVFDLAVNVYRPICLQAVVSKKAKRLIRLDFNPVLPVIVCGDSKGSCHVLKLSPNLRVMCKPPKKAAVTDQRSLQILKLKKLLGVVRDPPFKTGVVEEVFEDD